MSKSVLETSSYREHVGRCWEQVVAEKSSGKSRKEPNMRFAGGKIWYNRIEIEIERKNISKLD